MKHFNKVFGYAIAGAIAISLCGCGADSESVLDSPAFRTSESAENSVEDSSEESVAESTAEEQTLEESTTEEEESTSEETKESALVSFEEGTYTDENGDELSITSNNDGTYAVEVSLVRLAGFDDEAATVEGGKLLLNFVDPAGGLAKACFYETEDGSYTLEFTDIEWDYIKTGDTYESFSK